MSMNYNNFKYHIEKQMNGWKVKVLDPIDTLKVELDKVKDIVIKDTSDFDPDDPIYRIDLTDISTFGILTSHPEDSEIYLTFKGKKFRLIINYSIITSPLYTQGPDEVEYRYTLFNEENAAENVLNTNAIGVLKFLKSVTK